MPRWMRIARGMIGTGLTFAVGVGLFTGIVAGIAWLAHGISSYMLIKVTARISVVAFLLGVGFSGILAAIGRGRQFNKLSLRLVAGLGAGAGAIYFGLISLNGVGVWTPRAAVGNFVLLTVMGAASAVATLLIARRAQSALGAGHETPSIDAGDVEITQAAHTARGERHDLSR